MLDELLSYKYFEEKSTEVVLSHSNPELPLGLSDHFMQKFTQLVREAVEILTTENLTYDSVEVVCEESPGPD